jgi:hypothetical protein
VWIIAEYTFDLINSKSTYIITLLKDMSVRRKSGFTFYRNEETHYRITPFVRYYVKDVIILARISALY